MDEFLASPAARAIKVVAYADDIALSGKFPSTLNEIMESALRNLVRWANGSGLEINPSKTELVLFTRRRKLNNFSRPTLGGTMLSLSSEVKYLGIILDSKLDWKRNIEVRMCKAFSAFYSFKRLFRTRRGLLVVRGHHLTDPIIRVSGMVKSERN